MAERDDIDDVLEKYLNKNKMYHFEGDSGLKNLEKLFTDLGYRRSGFRFGEVIEVFLSDNPGAQEAIVEWLSEWVERNAEWKENLIASAGLEDEPSEDEEEPVASSDGSSGPAEDESVSKAVDKLIES